MARTGGGGFIVDEDGSNVERAEPGGVSGQPSGYATGGRGRGGRHVDPHTSGDYEDALGPAPSRKHSRPQGLRVRLSKRGGQTPKALLRAPIYFPAITNDFTPEETAEFNDFGTVGGGEFSQPSGGRQLRSLTVEFLTLTWAKHAKWAVHQDYAPSDIKKQLRSIMRSRRPVRLKATLRHGRHGPELQELKMDVTVRRITGPTLRHGEGDTRYYTVEFREWRPNPAQRRSHARGHGKHKLPTTKKLDDDDTLYSLARKYYGHATGWRVIARANGLKKWGQKTPIVKSKRFKVGDKIRIPALSHQDEATSTGNRLVDELHDDDDD